MIGVNFPLHSITIFVQSVINTGTFGLKLNQIKIIFNNRNVRQYI